MAAHGGTLLAECWPDDLPELAVAAPFEVALTSLAYPAPMVSEPNGRSGIVHVAPLPVRATGSALERVLTVVPLPTEPGEPGL